MTDDWQGLVLSTQACADSDSLGKTRVSKIQMYCWRELTLRERFQLRQIRRSSCRIRHGC